MIQANGSKRVIISHITPQIEGGKYPAKTVTGERFPISADIFSDGHDELAASVLIRHRQDRSWRELSMCPLGNDRWETIFIPEKTGLYQFQIIAWTDHYTTWKKGLVKKYEAGQDIHIELQIGDQLIRKATGFAVPKERPALERWWGRLTEAPGDEQAVLLALNDELAALMRRARDKQMVSSSAQTLAIDCERKKAAFSTWYELFPRSAAPEPGQHGTFKDVKALLPRIAAMGFDTLYLPPIHPIGEQKRKGRNNSLTALPEDPGSPWAIGNKYGGHKAVHPELGTLKDFQDLIQAAKKMDIEIAMDIAFQCAPDHPYVREHPQWFNWRPDGTVQYAENPPKKYEDILPFNFETEDWAALWNELKSVFEFWISKGVDVFRVDNPHTKAFPFWEWVIPEIRKHHPQVIFLAEAFTRPRVMERLAKIGYTQSYTYFTWRNTKQELEAYMTELTRTDMRYYFRPNFWPNTPDILPPALSWGGENAHISRLILAATLSSNYGLYGPVYEFNIHTPHPGKEEYTDNEKYEIKHWDWNAWTRIREIMTRINEIRKAHPALHTTWNIELVETTSDQIICYAKTDAGSGDRLLIAVNLDPYNTHSAMVRVPHKALGLEPGTAFYVRDLLSGSRWRWQDDWCYVELNPNEMPAHVFLIES